MKRKTILVIIAVGIAVLVALLLMLTVGPWGGSASGASRANLLKLARLYLEKGEYERALDLIDRLLLEDPDDAEALELQDAVLEAQRRGDTGGEARSEGSDALDELPGEDEGAVGDAVASTGRDGGSTREDRTAERTRNVPQGEDPAARAERERREKIQRLLQTGRERLDRKDYDGARRAFGEVLGLDPTDREAAEAHAYMGRSYYEEAPDDPENISEAVDHSERAVEKDPGLALPHKTLGAIYEDRKDWERAIAEYEEAARLDPKDYMVFYNLGKVQYNLSLIHI